MIQIITTTNNIDNATITNYKGLVSANIVIGANFFSDFAASITDVLGGQSSTYQSKLDELYDKVIIKIKQKAAYLNADAIVGFKIDFDEISGKGKSMFMVTAIGTAVNFRFNNTIQVVPIIAEPQIIVAAPEKEVTEEIVATDDELDEIEQQVILAIKNNKSLDARYLLMTKKGYNLSNACKRIEELEAQYNNKEEEDNYLDNIVLGAIISGNTTEVREMLSTKRNMTPNDIDLYLNRVKEDAGL